MEATYNSTVGKHLLWAYNLQLGIPISRLHRYLQICTKPEHRTIASPTLATSWSFKLHRRSGLLTHNCTTWTQKESDLLLRAVFYLHVLPINTVFFKPMFSSHAISSTLQAIYMFDFSPSCELATCDTKPNVYPAFIKFERIWIASVPDCTDHILVRSNRIRHGIASRFGLDIGAEHLRASVVDGVLAAWVQLFWGSLLNFTALYAPLEEFVSNPLPLSLVFWSPLLAFLCASFIILVKLSKIVPMSLMTSPYLTLPLLCSKSNVNDSPCHQWFSC